MAGRRQRPAKKCKQRQKATNKKTRRVKTPKNPIASVGQNSAVPGTARSSREQRSSSVESGESSELQARLNTARLSDDPRSSTSTTASSSSRKRKSVDPEGDNLPLAKRNALGERDLDDGFAMIPEEDDELLDDSMEEDEDHDENVFSDGESEEEEDDRINWELENAEFHRIQTALNDSSEMTAVAPPQLTGASCRGVGTPAEVWNLLCVRDSIIRPHKDILNGAKIQPGIRTVLVDWMMEVCDNLKLHRETFHLSVDYVDRFLAVDNTLPVDQFQLVGTTALHMAAKYEEIYPPKLCEFVEFTDNACTREQVLTCEMVMVSKLSWSLTTLTSIHWLNIYMQLLGSKEVQPPARHASEKASCVVANYLRDDYMNMAKVLDMALLEVDTHAFSYRELAAAVVFACFEPHALVQQVTGYSYEHLLHAVEWVEPCVKVNDRLNKTGNPLPVYGSFADDWHNIQTHCYDMEQTRREVAEERKKQRERFDAKLRTRPRIAPLRARPRNEL